MTQPAVILDASCPWGSGALISRRRATSAVRCLARSMMQGKSEGTRMAAAGQILAHYRWQTEWEVKTRNPEMELRELFSSDEKLLAWMEKTAPKLRARIQSRAIPERSQDASTSATESQSDR